MRDYADMASGLRYCSTNSPCEKCPYYRIGGDNCFQQVRADAADAIEELLARDVVPTDFHERCLRLEIEKRFELEKRLPHWISVEERLPEDGDIVLVYWYNVHCCERDNFSVMRFRKGRTVEELKQADFFRSCDQWGNNEKPYDWRDPHGPLSLFGQDVTHWMPLPEPPKEDADNG